MSPFERERIRERRRAENFWLAKLTLTFLVTLIIVLLGLSFFRTCSADAGELPVGPASTPENPQTPTDLDTERELVQSVADGFLKAIRSENWSWYDCGGTTSPEDEPARALELAQALRSALVEVKLLEASYLWAAAAIVYQESRGNPCAVGPNSREWAKKQKLVNKAMIRWTASDALKVTSSPKFHKRRVGIDLGIGQTIWPENAHVLDAYGNPRKATPEEMVTVEGGARAVAYHMLENSLIDPKRPWLYWPGKRDEVYGSKLAWIVRKMNGPSRTIGTIKKLKSR